MNMTLTSPAVESPNSRNLYLHYAHPCEAEETRKSGDDSVLEDVMPTGLSSEGSVLATWTTPLIQELTKYCLQKYSDWRTVEFDVYPLSFLSGDEIGDVISAEFHTVLVAYSKGDKIEEGAVEILDDWADQLCEEGISPLFICMEWNLDGESESSVSGGWYDEVSRISQKYGGEAILDKRILNFEESGPVRGVAV